MSRSYRMDTLVYDARLDDLKDSRSGRVVIVANGPSARRHNLAALRTPLFGMNIGWKLGLDYRHYAIIDRPHLEVPAVRDHPGLFNGSRDPRPIGVRVRPWGAAVFGEDLTVGAHMGSALMFTIECAVWLGYRDLRLVGVDLGSVNGAGHFDGSPCAAGMEAQDRELCAARPVLDRLGVQVRVTGAATRRCTAFEHEPFMDLWIDDGEC